MRVLGTDIAGEQIRIRAPRYRVEFWTMPSESAPQLDAWIVDEVDSVSEVLSWAEANSADRPYEVFAEYHADGDGTDSDPFALIRLTGRSPLESFDVATIRVVNDH